MAEIQNESEKLMNENKVETNEEIKEEEEQQTSVTGEFVQTEIVKLTVVR
jgi:hypothetical protein